MLSTQAPDDDRRAKFQEQMREREARSEYGVTVGDVRSFLKRARTIQIAVRVGETVSDSCAFLMISKTSFLKSLKYSANHERMPSVFDPLERSLVIGSLAAIHKAEGRS
jgi:hypothetical protein